MSPDNLQTPEEMLERWSGVTCKCDPSIGFLCECCHDTQVVRDLIKSRDMFRDRKCVHDIVDEWVKSALEH